MGGVSVSPPSEAALCVWHVTARWSQWCHPAPKVTVVLLGLNGGPQHSSLLVMGILDLVLFNN